MKWRLITEADHRVMPWKNGLGLTREIAIDPPDVGLADRFRWRLSIADVRGSGPFSSFPGYERTIMVIAGAGMELKVADQPLQLLDRPYVPFEFSGDEATTCRLLGGPIRDFNLMVRRSRQRSTLDIVRLDTRSRPTHSVKHGTVTMILHCFEGSAEVRLEGPPWTMDLSTDCTFIADCCCTDRGVMTLRTLGERSAVLAVIRLGKERHGDLE